MIVIYYSLLFCSIFIYCTIGQSILTSWTLVTDPPLPRTNYDMITAYDAITHKIWLLGGLNGCCQRHLIDYDINNNNFTQHTDLTTSIQVNSQSYTTIDRTIYFHTDLSTTDFGTFDMATQTLTYPWNSDELYTTGSGGIDPSNKYMCITSIHSRYLAILGGNTELKAFHIFDVETSSYVTQAPDMLSDRYHFACQVLNGFLYVICGYNSAFNQNEIERIDVSNISNIGNVNWELMGSLAGPSRWQTPRSVAIANNIYSVGGQGPGASYLDLVVRIAADGSIYENEANLLYDKYGHGLAATDERLYVFGGCCTVSDWMYSNIITLNPTPSPTMNPSNPTVSPTFNPTIEPTTPTNYPSKTPTSPTSEPTIYPTHDPTIDPTIDPTVEPTNDPTNDPTVDPTNDPTTDPTIVPTHDPTVDPTMDPTADPTTEPTNYPTIDPTVDPTVDPTIDPTLDPTTDPTVDPTFDPTQHPTSDPTVDPTIDPTSNPTMEPTSNPTIDPTTDPTNDPTSDPSTNPTYPTIYPTVDPTVDPTIDPSIVPTSDPTVDPTIYPTSNPTVDPTVDPTKDPTVDPTTDPTMDPTSDPTIDPTFDPTTDPTRDPTTIPTSEPTNEPTTDPTIDPTTIPTSKPTDDPTERPKSQEECDGWEIKIAFSLLDFLTDGDWETVVEALCLGAFNDAIGSQNDEWCSELDEISLSEEMTETPTSDIEIEVTFVMNDALYEDFFKDFDSVAFEQAMTEYIMSNVLDTVSVGEIVVEEPVETVVENEKKKNIGVIIVIILIVFIVIVLVVVIYQKNKKKSAEDVGAKKATKAEKNVISELEMAIERKASERQETAGDKETADGEEKKDDDVKKEVDVKKGEMVPQTSVASTGE